MNKMTPTDLESMEDSEPVFQRMGLPGYDEAFDDNGRVRSHWAGVMSRFAQMSRGELQLRSDRLARRTREAGIDYDIFSDPSRPSQAWLLDLMPILIAAAQWRWLQTALTQRARLFDAILHDVYGPQKTLKKGIIPPELVFSDPTYLTPCRDILPKAGPLRFYAADLARDDNGLWRVIDSHTETLAGLGFAVANRVIHSHVVGDVMRGCNATRLAAFSQNLQNALSRHAGSENARIAVLTPGPQHQDYFSHAYIARYLGYLLVEGGDLRTRGEQLCLKTLEGLQDIDLVVRCLDGRNMDPLELYTTRLAGPAGLLRVNRDRPNLVVNAIGTGIVQNRGLGMHLGRLAEELLGEELMLPDAPRNWLGDSNDQRYVLENLDRFVIRNAQEGTGRPGQAMLGQEVRSMTSEQRDLLVRSIALDGSRLVAEEELGFSHAPVWQNDKATSRPFAIRFFVAHTGERYEVMPGGLAMSVDRGRAVALSTVDGHTRDVWILGEQDQQPHFSLWRPRLENARVERSQRVIQSRVADDLYWIGRYQERADWTMRVLRSAYRRISEDSGPSTEDLGAVHRCLSGMLADERGPVKRPSGTNIDVVEGMCSRLLSGSTSWRTLSVVCENLYRCANLARDRLSFEAWHTLSLFRPGDEFMNELSRATSQGAILDMLDVGLRWLSAFGGLTHENMTRNYGWHFLNLGRRVERAYNLSEVLANLFADVTDGEDEMSALRLVLELADSFITYRSRYRIDPSLPLVLDLLLLDQSNPRSLAFQLTEAMRDMSAFPSDKPSADLSEARGLLASALDEVRQADVVAMATPVGRKRLAELVRGQLVSLPQFSDALARHYFNPVEDMPHRVHTRSEAAP
ncbi:MAG: circularly permuted type 2 ATP-grasp protein [Hyphomicrobiaceae bacterium]|nr:circularly permuted type 2 ATP-grasp protein [Hyphomicrobiaceae bacterium]